MKKKKCLLTCGILISAFIAIALPSCKAWRTVSTTATCVEQTDSTKTTTTISTKTVEEYQGVKK